jgi:hypothetical protein
MYEAGNKFTFMKGFAITFAGSFFAGYAAAYWTTLLDPGGTGGSILAFPAIMLVALVSIFLFFGGLAISAITRAGYYVMGASLMVPFLFLVSTILIRQGDLKFVCQVVKNVCYS